MRLAEVTFWVMIAFGLFALLLPQEWVFFDYFLTWALMALLVPFLGVLTASARSRG